LDGGGLNACLLHLPSHDPDSALTLIGHAKQEGLGARATVNTRLNMSLRAGQSVQEAVITLLTEPAANGWKPIQPTIDGAYEIWLGGLFWSAKTVRGGATFTDDYERADSADLGADWDVSATDVDRHLAIFSGIVYADAFPPCYEHVTSISPGESQYSLVTLDDINTATLGTTEGGATIRVTAGVLRNFYQCAAMFAGAGTTTQLGKRIDGTLTELASENATSWANTNTMRLSGSGTSITVQRNGSGTLLNATDSAHSGGSVGIYSFNGDGWCGISDYEGGDTLSDAQRATACTSLGAIGMVGWMWK
jgi:hypothetical protein